MAAWNRLWYIHGSDFGVNLMASQVSSGGRYGGFPTVHQREINRLETLLNQGAGTQELAQQLRDLRTMFGDTRSSIGLALKRHNTAQTRRSAEIALLQFDGMQHALDALASRVQKTSKSSQYSIWAELPWTLSQTR